MCVCPPYSIFASHDTLVVFAGRISSIKNLGACLLCFACAFFVFVDGFSCQLSVFVSAFFLFCCCVVCAARVSALFVVFMFLFVLRLGLDVLVSWLRVLCVCVHVLCRSACVSHVKIF